MKLSIDKAKCISIGVAVLGIAQTILCAKDDDNKRAELKKEVKEEIIKDLKK